MSLTANLMELKAAAENLANGGALSINDYSIAQDRYEEAATPSAILTLLALVEVGQADAARLDQLEQMGNQPAGLLLHDGGDFTGRTGLGLRRIGRTLRQAVDQATPSKEADHDA